MIYTKRAPGEDADQHYCLSVREGRAMDGARPPPPVSENRVPRLFLAGGESTNLCFEILSMDNMVTAPVDFRREWTLRGESRRLTFFRGRITQQVFRRFADTKHPCKRNHAKKYQKSWIAKFPTHRTTCSACGTSASPKFSAAAGGADIILLLLLLLCYIIL